MKMINPRIFEVSAAIIIDSKNRILLQKKDSGYLLGPNKWSLFGGKIEKSEDAKKTIQREIKEEVGMNFNEEKIRFFYRLLFEGDLNGKLFKINHHVFFIEFNKKISEIKIGEGVGFAFFEKNELEKLDLMPPTKKILEKFFNKNYSECKSWFPRRKK
jgi:mutator protein MutT